MYFMSGTAAQLYSVFLGLRATQLYIERGEIHRAGFPLHVGGGGIPPYKKPDSIKMKVHYSKLFFSLQNSN